MALTPVAIDALIVTIFEIMKALQRHNNGEEITDNDLNLESFEMTRARLQKEREDKGGIS